jgi:histidinol-phosphatase (PHP family)
MLPMQDGHVHTEWSWDTVTGSMEASCARALALGLSSIAFTDHVDFNGWQLTADDVDRLPDHMRKLVTPAGVLSPPPVDVAGYLESVRRCRERFPELRILTGVELSEPHRFDDRVKELLRGGDFERVLGSLHTMVVDGREVGVNHLYGTVPAGQLVREYLAEALRLVESSDVFGVLAHIDYAIRYWPASAGPFRAEDFEDEFRAVLEALARTDRALEVNTTMPPNARLVGWWRDVGGRALCFGSDAHDPVVIARRFEQAAAMVEAHGFRPGRDPNGFWTRSAPM